ncbi:MAG TPA: SDR family oxidoreductase [Methanoregula sp.]|nr:SDR family oxidoreductase [Methanoregula sp.]
MIFDPEEEFDVIQRNLGDISYEDQRVLVTGGAGFLGSWMCDALINSGAYVVCIDNFTSGQKENIKNLIDHERFRCIEHDISVPLSLNTHLDYVFHMASRASPFEFEHYPIQILKANTTGILVALGIAKKHGARIMFTSTSEVYGNPDVVPTPESYYGNVNPIGPRGCYDEAKRCGEAYVMAYRKQHKLDTRIARIFNTYGPRIRMDGIYGRVIPRFIDQALKGEPITVFGSGLQTRSFTYVTDQIEGLLRLASVDAACGQVINIGNVNEITVLALAKKVIEITGSSSTVSFHPLPQDDPLRRRPDVTRAKQLLGWEPKVPLDRGLVRTIEWIQSCI